MAVLINAQRIGRIISDRFGIEFTVMVEVKDGYPLLVIRPLDLTTPNGFSIEAHARWKSIVITFVPDNFASDLLREMSEVVDEKKLAFATFASVIRSSGCKLAIKVNGHETDLKPDDWPGTPWKNFSLSMERMGVFLVDENDDRTDSIIMLVTPFVGMVASLLPLEHEELPFLQSELGLPEGAKMRVEANKYERSPLNRQACISIYGARCQVCGINFGEVYGSLGEGYIHVHHVIPVSELGSRYILDPSKDLVPVCPNCHAMLHRKTPPLLIQDLKKIAGFS